MNSNEAIDEEAIRSFILGHIGQNAYISSIDDKDGKFNISIGISFPKLIIDEKIEEKYLKFIQFDNLHTFQITNRKEFTEKLDIPRLEIYKKAYTKFFELNMKTEDIVLEAIYSKLTKIPYIRTALSPIYSILYEAYTHDVIYTNEFKPRQRRYFNLLETLELIRKKERNTYGQGNAFIKIEADVRNEGEKEVIDYVFGYAIQRGKKYLIEHIKMNTLIPFIRIANTYYFQTLEANKLFNTKIEDLKNEYGRLYPNMRNIKTPKFEGLVNQIVDADILEQNQEYYIGYDNIFKKISTTFHNQITPLVIS